MVQSMKYNGRVVAGQYEFIEFETEGSPEEAVMAFKDLKRAYEGGSGVDTKRFNDLVDEYLSTGKVQNGGDVWEELDERQRWFFNEIKKSIKRRNND